MMKRSGGVKFYGVALIVYGAYNLMGVGDYAQFAGMFKPLSGPIVLAVYLFTIFYGICGIYCGNRILKLEDWARRMMVGLTAVSVIAGFLLNRIVMKNFNLMLSSEASGVTPDMAPSVYRFAIIFTALVTLFELSVVYYFTRPAVAAQFKKHCSPT